MEQAFHVLKDLVLENDVVRLRRIAIDDKPGYARIAFDPDIWTYFVSTVTDAASLDTFVEQGIRDTLNGTRIVFTILDKRSGAIAGSASYGNIAPADRRLEIGWSWLGEPYRGNGTNRAVKSLLLGHAFDALGCERVEFKTDVLNTRARKGLLGIGAKEEGVLRSFNVMPGGRRRDAIYYSILKAEWPSVRAERFHG
ncbi:GCN5-related N-acetyltransferase [plant metagenome]|uniref:GCN5-related N-acetyltransferase n=2 Tax=root TaxID=1 RepID=A0A1C3K8F2_9BURK|nr:GNAT family protein [Orrella dioscoreae]SBT27688.1 GCN5-related N-acetyltransferase [Orrella dioscoreae]SOE48545.1 GCN5-related N-acetyltransferase [Orrella dioscoreae]